MAEKQFSVYFEVNPSEEKINKKEGGLHYALRFYPSARAFQERTDAIIIHVPVRWHSLTGATHVRDTAYWNLTNFDELRSHLLHLYQIVYTEKIPYENAKEFWRTTTFLLDAASSSSKKHFRSLQLLSEKLVDISIIYRNNGGVS